MERVEEVQYQLLVKKYDNLMREVLGNLEDFLIENNVAGRVEYRAKSWDSFQRKTERKEYKDALYEMNDIFGLRVIINDSLQLNKISKIIKEEFIIKEFDDKSIDVYPNQFGYRSNHFIVAIKKEWMATPRFRNSKDLKIEIQTRSALMDTWANISHQIFYKQGEISTANRRRLYRLSALMEIGDSEISQLTTSVTKGKSEVLPPEMKALQEVLDQFVPDRKRTPYLIPLADLLRDMSTYNFPLEALIKHLETKLEKLLVIEEEAFSELDSMWWQIGIVRGFMYLTIDEYWTRKGTRYTEHFVSVIESHRINF